VDDGQLLASGGGSWRAAAGAAVRVSRADAVRGAGSLRFCDALGAGATGAFGVASTMASVSWTGRSAVNGAAVGADVVVGATCGWT
jgi:hypothetical protein